ncbi:uncharacterized protein [Euphorbia lathyris]|uniref:uncharacterized protein n=1 Tax=Euphorbia lathyris TaxID=212925 RepID=UPI0033137935
MKINTLYIRSSPPAHLFINPNSYFSESHRPPPPPPCHPFKRRRVIRLNAAGSSAEPPLRLKSPQPSGPPLNHRRCSIQRRSDLHLLNDLQEKLITNIYSAANGWKKEKYRTSGYGGIVAGGNFDRNSIEVASEISFEI